LLLGQTIRICFSHEFFEKNEDAETSSFLPNMIQDDRQLKNFSEFRYSSEKL